jgi:hypothetical protein
MTDSKLQQAHRSLQGYIENASFKGFDPYDTLNSPWPFGIIGKWGPVLAIQFQKRNPVNIRPLLGIRKDTNPKAMGLFLHAYSLLYKHSGEAAHKQQATELFEWLIANTTEGYSGQCWGYNFDWASPVKYLKAFSPTIVVSGFIAKGVFEYHQATQDPRALETLQSIAKFMHKDLAHTADETGVCVSYSTVTTDCCYNASMLGAELLADIYSITGEAADRDLALRIADFTVARQQEEGHWNYSIDLPTGKERTQIDFHQGYVLDSLHAVQKHCKPDHDRYQKAIKKGLDYYRERQFSDAGVAIWRVPKKWPVEIHNQSQGIISFTRLAAYRENSDAFAEQIAHWTVENMQGRDGHFYYKKYPAYKIKTSFIRWSQAWMFLALTELLVNED